ncbi:hypothetical protein [Deinococcus alpinitundrae]|uniref:hypothetical protein n=1 Tax=Deinococcus alpinitundrae TaxID=468913 RepID=UPI001379D0FA|nr:hypothetical protein [Deinococcus alpinitundrae]
MNPLPGVGRGPVAQLGERPELPGHRRVRQQVELEFRRFELAQLFHRAGTRPVGREDAVRSATLQIIAQRAAQLCLGNRCAAHRRPARHTQSISSG